MSILSKVFLAACAVVSVTAAVPDYASFCERYTGALFGDANNATQQLMLVKAVVNGAVLGQASASNGGFPAFTGIVAQNSLMGYFNGTLPPMVDYVTNYATNAHFAALAGQLYNFFLSGLHCRAGAAAWPFVATGTLHNLHSAMMITDAQEALFGMIVGQSAGWYGVNVAATGSTTESAYVGAVFKQFGRDGGDNAICTETGAANCVYQPLVEVWTQTSPAAFLNAAAEVNGDVMVAVGGNVHWNIGASHNVRQVDDATSTTPTAGGWGTSAGAVGGAGATLTVNFPTAGTYYYICQPHVASSGMRGRVIVGGTPSSASTVAVSAFAVAAVALAAAKLL